MAVLDEIDSGLDIDALRDVADAVNGLKRPDSATLMVTHYKARYVPLESSISGMAGSHIADTCPPDVKVAHSKPKRSKEQPVAALGREASYLRVGLWVWPLSLKWGEILLCEVLGQGMWQCLHAWSMTWRRVKRGITEAATAVPSIKKCTKLLVRCSKIDSVREDLDAVGHT